MIVIQKYMQQRIETLADFVSRIMDEKNLSGYDIERLSKNSISQSYANRIKNGDTTNPTIDALKALAKGLGINEEEIFAVARGNSLNKKEVPLRIKTEGFEGLDEGDLKTITDLMRFLKTQKK